MVLNRGGDSAPPPSAFSPLRSSPAPPSREPLPFQLPGTAGCIGATSADGCAQGVALLNAHAVLITPDGRHAYVLAATDDAVAVFDRNLQTGALTQKAGIEACISETGSGGMCSDLFNLDNPESMALNPDSQFLHVASFVSNAVTTVYRNPVTGNLGALIPGSCIRETGGGLCYDGRGLDGPSSLVTSPTGLELYVASFNSDAVTMLLWNPFALTLTQDVDPEACVSETGSGGACVDGYALDAPFDVAMSPDGLNLYVASWGSHAIAVFDRPFLAGPLPKRPAPAAA